MSGITNRSVLASTLLMAGGQLLGMMTAPGPRRPSKEEVTFNPGDAAQVWSYIAGTVETYPHLITYTDFKTKKVKNDVAREEILLNAGLMGLSGYLAGGGHFGGPVPDPPTAYIGLAEGTIFGAVTAGLGALRTESYRCYMGFVYGICNCGGTPIDSIEAVKVDERIVSTGPAAAGSTILLDDPQAWGGDHSAGGVYAVCDVVGGNLWPTQQPNPYLVSQFGSATPAYQGKALFIIRGPSGATESGYFAATGDASAGIPLRPVKLRVKRLPSVLGVPEFKDINDGDANAAECIYEWLTNPSFGARKVPSSKIDIASFREVAETLFDDSLGFSDEFNSAVDVETALDIFTSHSDLVLFGSFRSPGQIKLKAVRRDYSVPSLPVYRLGSSPDVTDPTEYNVIRKEGFSPGAWSRTANEFRWEFTDRNNNFQRTSRTVHDLANRMVQGRSKQLSQDLRGVSNATSAAVVGTREMRAGSYPNDPITLIVNRQGYEQEPADVIKLIDAVDGFTKILRIAEVQVPDSESSEIGLVCLEDMYGVGAAAYGTQTTIFTNPTGTPVAASVTTQTVVLEAPYYYAASDVPKLLAFVSKPNGAQVSYDLYVSEDGGASYVEQAHSADFAIKGTITEAIARLTDDVLTSLTFTPSDSFEATRLQSVTEAQIAGGANLVYFPTVGEFMAVETITDNGDGSYTLSSVWRAVGALDTPPVPHSAGAAVWFFTYGRVVTPTSYPDPTATKTKVLPKTISNTLPIASATAINLTVAGRAIKPSPVRGVTVGGSYTDDEIGASDDLAIAWKETNRLTEGAIVKQTDAGVEPEDTTTYTVRFYATETITKLLRTETGIAASTGTQGATLTTAEEAASANYLGYLSPSYRVEIDVLRDGETSATYVRELARAGGTGGLFHIDNILPAQIFDDPFAVSDDVDLIGVEVFS